MTRRSAATQGMHLDPTGPDAVVPHGVVPDDGRAAAGQEGRVLSRGMAYALAAMVIGLGLFASVTPSPLYRLYMVKWHFSALTLTLIYATYAFGVLATLLIAGRASDQVGRRPVLLAALAALMLSTVLFIAAASPAWLFVARGLQGVATGAALSAASAALLDLHPRRDSTGVALANAVASAAGIGSGVLISSTLVQLAPAPTVMPYVVLFLLFAVAFAGAFWMPESVQHRSGLRLTLQRPTVPAVARRPFLLASLAVFASWSIGGLFFSLGPQLAGRLFESGNVIVSGIGVVALAGFAALAQLVFGRVRPWLGASAGAVVLAAGTVLIVVASVIHSGSTFLVGSTVGGVGFGVTFLSGLRALVAVIPNEQRASVMSAFYVVAYLSLSVPAVLAGLVVGHLGLELTFEIFGVVVAAVALLVAVEAWRSRARTLSVSSPARLGR